MAWEVLRQRKHAVGIVSVTSQTEIDYCLFVAINWAILRQIKERVRRFRGTDEVAIARAKLPHKSQSVLDQIENSYPETLSRAQIIDHCWNGNDLVGEKGLNHALWAIRQALGDDARNPSFIRTVAREGYVWIGPVRPKAGNRPEWYRRPAPAIAATFFALAAAILSQAEIRMDKPVTSSSLSAPDGESVTYFRGRDIVVERNTNRTLIMKPSGDKRFGNPSYSRDGRLLAFPLYGSVECELVVVSLSEPSYKKFRTCPA